MRHGTAYLHRFILAGLGLGAAVAFYGYALERDTGELAVYFLDVGQGDAAYIRTPSGHDMLVDAGPSSIVVRRLADVMPWYDRRIDVVVATHPDADHIGGLPEMLERYEVGVVIEPGVESDNGVDDEVDRLLAEKRVHRMLARFGRRIDFGDGAYFDIVFPDTDVSSYETNAASIVGRLAYGSTSVMLAADSPKSIENRLVARFGTRLQSDILKVGHHGSRTSSGQAFVAAVAPSFTVISAGRDNRYGHPHPEVVETLSAAGTAIAETWREGTLRFVSDGAAFERK